MLDYKEVQKLTSEAREAMKNSLWKEAIENLKELREFTSAELNTNRGIFDEFLQITNLAQKYYEAGALPLWNFKLKWRFLDEVEFCYNAIEQSQFHRQTARRSIV